MEQLFFHAFRNLVWETNELLEMLFWQEYLKTRSQWYHKFDPNLRLHAKKSASMTASGMQRNEDQFG